MPVFAEAKQAQEIDVIVIERHEVGNWSDGESVPGPVAATWAGKPLRKALELVATLPPSQAMRCFIPGYAMRLRQGDRVLSEIAFCFKCHNAMRLVPGGETTWFTFDPESQPALDLLRRFTAPGAAR